MERAGLAYIAEGLTPEQKKGEFIIGSSWVNYGMEDLVDELSDNEFKKRDYELITAYGDDFPNMIKITPQSLSRILANQEMVYFLQDLEGDDDTH